MEVGVAFISMRPFLFNDLLSSCKRQHCNLCSSSLLSLPKRERMSHRKRARWKVKKRGTSSSHFMMGILLNEMFGMAPDWSFSLYSATFGTSCPSSWHFHLQNCNSTHSQDSVDSTLKALTLSPAILSQKCCQGKFGVGLASLKTPTSHSFSVQSVLWVTLLLSCPELLVYFL